MLSAGYQHPPVLTEKDLLTLQSPDYNSNIFKNSVENISVIINKSGAVSYVFKTVTDANVFLFEVAYDKELRTLGKLKESSKNLALDPKQGQFVLTGSAEDPKELDRVGAKHKFKISTKKSQQVELKFEKKSNMFKFLISKEGMERRRLRFDQRQILNLSNLSNDAISSKSVEKKVGSDPPLVERKEPEGRADDQNNIVDVQEEDTVEEYKSIRFSSLLELEVQDLRAELDAKDDVIERLKLQNKKMEKKYYDLQDQFEKIGSIVESACVHQEQQ